MTSPNLVIKARGCPVKLVRNHCGNVFSICHIDDASRFAEEADAREAILEWKLLDEFKATELSIEPASADEATARQARLPQEGSARQRNKI